MNDFLLDTHVLLWLDTDPERIPEGTLELIRQPNRKVYVSSVTAWELSIKHSLGKLPEADALLKDYALLLEQYGLF